MIKGRPEQLDDARAVILVEGESDRAAVEAAAATLNFDLGADDVQIRVLGGATNFDKALRSLRDWPDMVIAGLCDANEASMWRDICGRHDSADVRFYVCDRDLEDELLRACGIERVETYIESVGELRPLRTMRKQGPWIDKPAMDQLHRFIRVKATRNIGYGSGLMALLDADEIPKPIAALLRSVCG